MIIKKKGNNKEPDETVKSTPKKARSRVIKAQDVQNLEIKKRAKNKTSQIDANNLPAKNLNHEQKTEKQPEKTELEIKLEEYEKIDVTVPEFKERFERRRGERRRGFRRIDERTLVSRAQEEAQNIREVAAKEGYKNGLLEAQNEIDMIKTSLEEFTGAKRAALEEVSEHVLEIALAVAKKIIKKEVELSGEVLKSVMSEVLSELEPSEERITVKVNPEDVDFAKASLPDVLSENALDAKVSVMGDELIERGSCTVIASNGVIDANFSTQLSIIQNAFGIYNGGK